MVALGRVVLSTREHVIALEARDKGILGMLLHYPYEVRKPEEYFGDMFWLRPTARPSSACTCRWVSRSGLFSMRPSSRRYGASLNLN
jgi:hypothetical protein